MTKHSCIEQYQHAVSDGLAVPPAIPDTYITQALPNKYPFSRHGLPTNDYVQGLYHYHVAYDPAYYTLSARYKPADSNLYPRADNIRCTDAPSPIPFDLPYVMDMLGDMHYEVGLGVAAEYLADTYGLEHHITPEVGWDIMHGWALSVDPAEVQAYLSSLVSRVLAYCGDAQPVVYLIPDNETAYRDGDDWTYDEFRIALRTLPHAAPSRSPSFPLFREAVRW